MESTRPGTVPREAATVVASRRDVAIDSLRGVAIILMVAGHVIGGTAAAGMQVADDSSWRYSYLLLEDLRMPLFTALSGFVYALRPLGPTSGYGRFVKGKSRRLLVPLLTVGTAFVLLQALTPGTNAGTEAQGFWRVYVYGDPGHFWFLQAIFLILLLVGLLDVRQVLRTPGRVVLGVGIATALSLLVRVPDAWDVFSVNGALRLLPFFLLGYGVSRYWSRVPTGVAVGLVVACVLLLVARALEIFDRVALPAWGGGVLGAALGLAGIAALLALRERLAVGALARLGYFSFSIYLLHVFGTAPTRMVLGRIGVDSEVVVFACCLAMGLALPVLFVVTLGRVPWVSWAVLGQRPYRSPKT